MAAARAKGYDPIAVAGRAVVDAGYKDKAALMTRDALLRNLAIADKLGCLAPDGLNDMRHGRAPTVRKGPYAGDQLSVDHIIPRTVVPELDNVIANLELMPHRMNSRKSDAVGDRQKALARKLHEAGLLSKKGLGKVVE